MALSLTNMSLLKRPPILDFILLTHTTLGSEEPMKIPTDLSDNICPKAPRWRHLLKQSAMRLHTNLTTDPELVWALKHRRNVLLNIIAERCTSNLILRNIPSKPPTILPRPFPNNKPPMITPSPFSSNSGSHGGSSGCGGCHR
ncbi:hypothetical protein VCSRO153_3481 [Vibrio cholerae]|nr:hypothetical protein VCSRO153_3481 [Vibrio cholerae]